MHRLYTYRSIQDTTISYTIYIHIGLYKTLQSHTHNSIQYTTHRQYKHKSIQYHRLYTHGSIQDTTHRLYWPMSIQYTMHRLYTYRSIQDTTVSYTIYIHIGLYKTLQSHMLYTYIPYTMHRLFINRLYTHGSDIWTVCTWHHYTYT
jgi:hypothetical protein